MTNGTEAIPVESLATARAWVRNELGIRHLPDLPDEVATTLFLQGRIAWTFRYSELRVAAGTNGWQLQFKVAALLKKEFRSLPVQPRHSYQASLWLENKDGSTRNMTISEDQCER